RITAITSNGQPVISQITYEPDGQVNGWNWGNNQQNERFYDLSGHNIIVSMGFNASTQMPDSRYYGYDAAGRQTSAIDDSDPKLNQRHDYDQLDRLTSSQRGEQQTSRTDYAYDLSGNRTEKIKDNATLYSYSTDANSNRLQSQSGAQTASYSYDPAGNLTSDGSFNYSYNAAGRRIATTDTTTGQTTHYGYDPLGQRISKTNAGNTSQYFYDEQGHLTGEYDATGQLIQEIIWLGDLPVAVLKPTTTPANPTATADIYYIHADHLSTPRKITLPIDNRVVWSWESEAFGNSLPEQTPSGLGDFVFNLRFPGQYYDQETGLFYNYFRDYDPAKGRYIESDPIGLAAGINTYTYVSGNPVNYTDPLGLYETTNCSPRQEKKIENACPIAQKKADKAGIGKEFSGILDKTTFDCKPPKQQSQAKKDCGINYKSTIYLIRAFDPKACGSLASVIGHEGTHSPPLNYTEDKAYIYEYLAFGTPLPTPEKFRQLNEYLTPDLYLNYEKFYNGTK
ncbi:MAG TPA: RHS repeat-associated core domain-containing protein, partial [Methylobacter sp.]